MSWSKIEWVNSAWRRLHEKGSCLVDADYSAPSLYGLGSFLRRHVDPRSSHQCSIDFDMKLEVLEFERDLWSAVVRPHD
jgi:hypothetical protein